MRAYSCFGKEDGMKVILSRKGFDSKHGGYPSPILSNGQMVSLPIPDKDGTRYSELRIGNETYYDLMKQLKPEIRYDEKWQSLTEETICHVDPDIYEDILPRYRDWRPCFGQSGAAQSHLAKQKVQKGDLFLFFGWFRKTGLSEKTEKSHLNLRFHGGGFHAIFGYMQIGKIVKCDEYYQEPIWMRGHPHLLKKMRKGNNTIYIANDGLTWNNDIPGGGVFRFDQSLVLTKKEHSRSHWELPDFFRSVNISYHFEGSWRDGYFQSATIGQEFVIEPAYEVERWARELVEKCKACTAA